MPIRYVREELCWLWAAHALAFFVWGVLGFGSALLFAQPILSILVPVFALMLCFGLFVCFTDWVERRCDEEHMQLGAMCFLSWIPSATLYLFQGQSPHLQQVNVIVFLVFTTLIFLCMLLPIREKKVDNKGFSLPLWVYGLLLLPGVGLVAIGLLILNVWLLPKYLEEAFYHG